MAMTHIYGMAFEIDGDTALVEQDDGSGQVSRVQLHRLHIEHLADELGTKQAFPFLQLYAKHLRRLRSEFDSLMECQVSPPGSDILVDGELYLTLLGLQTLIESMCDSLPEEERSQEPDRPIHGASPKHSKDTGQLSLIAEGRP